MNRSSFIVGAAAGLGLAGVGGAVARADAGDPPKSWQEVRALIARFIDAQNAHDLDVTSALLLNTGGFQMQETSALVQGHDAAVNRFQALYVGMWRLSPDYGSLDITVVDQDHATITLPIEYKAGEQNDTPLTTESIVNLQAVRTGDGWRVASLMPKPPPTTTR